VALGDVATWVSAIGTVLAVVVALWFSGRDGRRRRKEERRYQAERITAWIDRLHMPETPEVSMLTVAIQNASDQLAYRVVVSLVRDPRGARDPKHLTDDLPRDENDPVNAFKYRAFIGELPPGRTVVVIDYPGGGSHLRWTAELAFQDAGGRFWVRDRGGLVREIRTDSLAHYKLFEPVDWEYPQQQPQQ
jgi:hypothetical protein